MTSVGIMAITYTTHPRPDKLTCAICRVNLPLSRATAGLYDCDNHQAFSCISHLFEVEKLIVGWADFITTELEKLKQKGSGNDYRFYA